MLFFLFQFEMAVITKDGVVIEPATSAETNWEIAPMVKWVSVFCILLFFSLIFGFATLTTFYNRAVVILACNHLL